MIYILLCIIIAGLIYTIFSVQNRYRRVIMRDTKTIDDLRAKNYEANCARASLYAELEDLKSKIRARATPPEIVEKIQKRYTGAELRRFNDRINAKLSEAFEERPNSEILKEQEHG